MLVSDVPETREEREQEERRRGLRCKYCNCVDVGDVHRTEPQTCNRIKRVRICRACGKRNVTYERVAD